MAPIFSITHFRTSPTYAISSSSSSYSYSTTTTTTRRREKVVVFSHYKFPFKSFGDSFNLNHITPSSIQERMNAFLSRTKFFLNEVASPLAKPGQNRMPDPENDFGLQVMEDIFMVEQTIDRRTPNGTLSLAAIICIEQFSRMNGLTGKKMQKIFKTLVPKSVYSNARNLVEYCCFRFLSRDGSDIHPSLKDPPFQRLIFLTMLAWENPYIDDISSNSEKASLQSKLVTEEAFVRIAPAVSGVADRPTVHNLFKALVGDQKGVSLSLWLTYINEYVKVREEQKSYQIPEFPQLSEERILCIGSNSKRPVLKWENNMAWPGKLTLTDKAIYFEAVGFLGEKRAMRLDLTYDGMKVEKAKVGPLGSALFDSAVSVSSGSESNWWVLEFIDLGGEMRREVWHALMSEVIALHKFVHEYGPDDSDESLFNVYGAHKGKERATISAISGLARLQTLQRMRKLLDDPTKLVQFSYLQNAPHGDVVFQTLAVNYWGGPLITGFVNTRNQPETQSSDEIANSPNHVFDIDGSVFLQKWMESPSWVSSASTSFWKNASTKGLILSKNLVVADASLIERAAETSKKKYRVVEKTQATIDAATLKGIPSNIDLFKELMLPFTLTARNFEKLRRWEEPHLTVAFLGLAYTIIFRNLLSYMIPAMMIILAAGMLIIRGLREQGRLGRSFGKITIRDQPPSNTIQKLIGLKDGMRDVENMLQQMNVSLLKMRAILLSGHPQITTEVAVVLLCWATILLILPFKYIISFVLMDMFTRELQFRREMVKRFKALLRERWNTVPASPVAVLPFENQQSIKEFQDKSQIKGNSR
ncbi:hypothetical protein Lal_00044090 [Lupinus albus]|uniref:Uncharacterized protein n=1 Tax=Lupinus albus TaxID=3870 RepID=A0A6A4PBL9_LUPAL|nr:hypothetical protein Lalb_Chr15g0090641 [Lupinus albus]KAF1895440.1 hypothetical protein Lal_00044090 [Lupinus albus]